MHAAYKEEDERALQHAGKEELACHCRLRPRGGGAHGGCRGGSRSHACRACKPGANAEFIFEALNAMWILQSEGAIWVSRLFGPLDATWMTRRASSTSFVIFFHRSVELLSQID